MNKLNWLDKVISVVSPTVAYRRMRMRLALSTMDEFGRKYDGASKNKRLGNWFVNSTSANTETFGTIQILRDRARDLQRNDPHFSKAIQVIAGKTIGAGIVPTFYSKNKKQAAEIQRAFDDWANSSQCDFGGQFSFYGLQALAMSTIARDGEILAMRIRTKARGDKIPLQIQLKEPDHIAHSKDEEFIPIPKGISPGGRIIQGVEFDGSGKKQALYLYPVHPGDRTMTNLHIDRVPLTEVAHIYRPERAGQVRGITWGAPVIMKLRDFNDLEDAKLMSHKIAACFSVFVYDSDPTNDYSQATTDITETVGPGRVEVLPPGKDIKFATPPTADGFSDYSAQVLRAIASGLGITYESLTGDYSRVNFSSGRMGWIEMQSNIDQWRWNMFIPQFCDQIVNWWLEAAALVGYRVDGVTYAWTAPAREMIDPGKEISAIKDSIRIGLKSLSQAIREQGEDPQKVLAEKKSDNDLIDSLGLTLDCDPRQVTEFGMSQPVPAGQSQDSAPPADNAPARGKELERILKDNTRNMMEGLSRLRSPDINIESPTVNVAPSPAPVVNVVIEKSGSVKKEIIRDSKTGLITSVTEVPEDGTTSP